MAYTLQLKRHVNYEDKKAALEGLQAYLATAAVGEPAIATYGGSEQTYDSEKVLFGIKGAHGYTIFNADAIPSEVQAALNAAIAAIKGNGAINEAYDTIKEIADALVKINGSGDGSISKAKQEAKDYADGQINAAVQALDVSDTAVAKSFVTEVSEADGKIAVKRGAITSKDKTVVIGDGADGGIDLKANVDGTTIVVNDGVMSVASAALVQYVGQNAIAVSEEDGGQKTISLKLNADDKVLTQTTNGLLANIGLTWSNTDGLKLTGKNGTEIATVPATDFIKDGMLQNVELKVATTKAPIANKTSGTFLVFTFNTDAGSKVINLDVTSLIDVYTAGDGISVKGKVIAAKLADSTEAFLTVDANGIKLSGVQDAINAAIDTAKQDVQAAIDKVESSVGLAANGSHVTATGNYTKDATTVVGEIAALDTQVKNNADAIAAEKSRATTEETRIVKDVIGALPEGQSVMGLFGEFATDAGKQITALDTQVTKNTEAIAALDTQVKAATAEETRIAKTVIGEGKLEEGKSVMDVILENEETAQQAIKQLANAAGVLSGEQIKYTAPTKSGEFSSTTSIMDMLNKIDEKWNTIDCGTY